jgi:hypothetical protein
MPDSDEPNEHGSFSTDEPLAHQHGADANRPFSETLGIEATFASEEFALTVDEQRLTAFVRDEVSQEEWHAVWHLVTTYRSWYDAWRRLMQNEARSNE